MEEDQQFCLRWNNHQSTLISVFDTLLENGTLVDCTLAAEGKFLKAHKVVLSACSPYFATLLSEQYDKHPIFILKDVKYQELRAMMDYMYRGEVNISQDQLAALLKAAESLQIKGLSDNRGGAGSGGVGAASGGKAGEPQKHSTGHVPGKLTNIGHIGAGYTLEQHKRARIGPSSIDSQDIGGSREGSSSPTSRRRKKIRRRSVDQVMGDNHENSNSSQNMQINSSVTGPGAITTSIVPSGAVAQAASGNQIQTQTNKKTDILSKLDQGVSVSTINPASATAAPVGSAAGSGTVSEHEHEHDEGSSNKKEHHHNLQSAIKKDKEVGGGGVASSAASSSDIVIEPKSEYDDGNEETVEDLTLDDEIALDELDQTAGPSHGGEGSSQGYAQWQVDRSHDESYMAQDVQQRDPQAKQDKGEQTDMNEGDFELDDCLLESNNIVITQNKDGYVLHVQKLGNVTEEAVVAAAQAATGSEHTQITSVQELKPHLATLQTSHAIKLPSSECELINIKKAPQPQPLQPTASSTPITTATIIHQPTIQHQPTTQHIVANQQTINTLLGIGRNVQIETKNLRPHIKYSRGNIITTQSGTTTTVMTTADLKDDGKHEKYEITEIDLNAQNSASIISDLVKYAEIDDIELPDGTKIGFGIGPQEITTHHHHHHHIDTSTQGSGVEHVQQSELQAHEHQEHDHELHQQEHLHHQQQSEQVSGVVVSDVSVHETHQAPTITKSYTILQSRPIKHEQSTTYELSLSDSSLTQGDESNEQKLYVCRHCGKKYRWKSTLRRHENVECGGKEPCHPCPYCSYKAKQRGNLGVHVRKHHPEKPQLESKRGKK